MLGQSWKLDNLSARAVAALDTLRSVTETGVKCVQPESAHRSASTADVNQTIVQFENRWLFANKRSPANIHLSPSQRRLGCGSGNLKHRSINRVRHSFVENLIGSPRAIIFPSAREQGAGRLTLAPASPLQPLSPPGLL